jgi:hypothetical protein
METKQTGPEPRAEGEHIPVAHDGSATLKGRGLQTAAAAVAHDASAMLAGAGTEIADAEKQKKREVQQRVVELIEAEVAGAEARGEGGIRVGRAWLPSGLARVMVDCLRAGLGKDQGRGGSYAHAQVKTMRKEVMREAAAIRKRLVVELRGTCRNYRREAKHQSAEWVVKELRKRGDPSPPSVETVMSWTFRILG